MRTILDFGCGDGGYDEILPDRLHTGSYLAINGGKGALGVDYNPEKVVKANKTINNGTAFLVGDGAKLPLKSNIFNHVHCFGTLHHMADYHEGISEVMRVLKRGGAYYIVEAVDNDTIYKLGRDVVGKWQGDGITSRFTTYELEDALRQKSVITSVQYYYRFIWSEILRMYHIEPRASLYLNHWYSLVLDKIGLAQECCCHVVINGYKP